MGYVVASVFVCAILWFALKPVVGYLALRRDPIAAGQNYIKRLLHRVSSVNAGLICDEAYKHLARQGFQIAELAHTVEHQTLFGAYMSYLDLYIQQIQIVMSGNATDLESPVVDILMKYGVPIPKNVTLGTESGS